MSEQAYINGHRQATLTMLRHCIRELLGDGDEVAQGVRAIAQLEETRLALRAVCGRHGCNDWPEDLHLADVVEKHLGRLLDELQPDLP